MLDSSWLLDIGDTLPGAVMHPQSMLHAAATAIAFAMIVFISIFYSASSENKMHLSLESLVNKF